MTGPRRLAVIASASGNGKATLGRELARRLDVPFLELDALVHGPNWTETTDEVPRDQLRPILGSDAGWLIDSMTRLRPTVRPLGRLAAFARHLPPAALKSMERMRAPVGLRSVRQTYHHLAKWISISTHTSSWAAR
jgi:hypothetical protein